MPRKVLIVEDDTNIAELLELFLEKVGVVNGPAHRPRPGGIGCPRRPGE